MLCVLKYLSWQQKKNHQDVCIWLPWENEWSRWIRRAGNRNFNRHTCWAMRAIGVRCIQRNSPTTAKREGHVVGVLFVQQLSTEKRAWKCYWSSQWVCDDQSIKSIQITAARNNCTAHKFHSHLCTYMYFSLLPKMLFILHSWMRNDKLLNKSNISL